MNTTVVDLSKVDSTLNEQYKPYLSDFRRYQVLKGGAGAGKSVFVAQGRVYNTILRRGFNGMALRKVGVNSRNSTYAEIRKCIYAWGLSDLFDCTVSPMEIRCRVNGNKIVFFGLDDVEKLKSVTFETGDLVWIWVEEASEITEEDFMQLDLRLRGRGDIPKHIILSFNPIDIDSWLKPHFFDRPLPKADGFILETTYKDNAYLDAPYKQHLEGLKDVDEYFYSVYVLNQWGARTTATVFHNLKLWDFELGESDLQNVRFGMDFGFNHANALMGTGFRDGELYLWYEVYAKHQQNKEFIAAAQETGIPELRTIKADSAEPDKIAEWVGAGYKNCFPTSKYPGSLKRQVHFLRDLPKINIHMTLCPNAAREFPRFRYRQLKDGTVLDHEFVELDDDTIAATRYACDDLVIDAEKSHFFIKRTA